MKKFISKREYCTLRKVSYCDFDNMLIKTGLCEFYEYGMPSNKNNYTRKRRVVPKRTPIKGVVYDKGAKSGAIGSRTYYWNVEYLDSHL